MAARSGREWKGKGHSDRETNFDNKESQRSKLQLFLGILGERIPMEVAQGGVGDSSM